jgi:hypothetical protein
MSASKSLSSKGGNIHSKSLPSLIPVAVADAVAAEVSSVESNTGGRSINISVNISGTDDGKIGGSSVSTARGFGGAAALQAFARAGDIVEEARSPSHKKKRGNKSSEATGKTEYTVSGGIDEAAARKFLTDKDWPPGLQTALINSCIKMPVRFFITDDSGSMLTNDGHRFVGTGDKTKLIRCTRWSELASTLLFHAELSHVAHAPSEFRLLNNAEPVLVGMPGDNDAFNLVKEVLTDGPGGQTPICAQIREVVAKIAEIEGSLRSNNQRAAVIICTDGQSTDGDVAEAMRPLQELPVWVVVRLCTDADDVIDYWNNVDGELELEMDVRAAVNVMRCDAM